MDIAGKARKIERKLARTVDAAIGELVGRDEPAPLEIVHAVLERAEHEVQDIGRGRHVFPFNCVRVHVVAGVRDRGAKARFDAVLAGPPTLVERLTERLRSAGCQDVRVTTDVVYVKQRSDDWEDPRFHVTFDRVPEAPAIPPPPPAAPAEVPRLKLTVAKGTADQRAYAFTGGRVDVGRRAEVVDQKQRLIRTNQIAFSDEGPEENRTVSRRHAHIAFVESEACYRIWDDRSAHGTSIVRGGRTIKVPPGARGTRLEAGDEIALGHARLKVEKC
jgi:pSer/pThr/pTyr-binding forkhead associated (FHA) protein